VVHGDMPDDERQETLRRFKEGQYTEGLKSRDILSCTSVAVATTPGPSKQFTSGSPHNACDVCRRSACGDQLWGPDERL
jgi:superfamily II DNA/RNA helicase